MKQLFSLVLFVLFALNCMAQDPSGLTEARKQATTLLSSEWDDQNGMLLYGLAALAEASQNEDEFRQVDQTLQPLLAAEGMKYPKGQLDAFLLGKSLIKAYTHAQAKGQPAETYKKLTGELHNYLVIDYPRIKKTLGKTCFLHKANYKNQMWQEDLFTGSAFDAQWLQVFDPWNKAGWSDIAVQFITLQNQAYNPVLGLTYPHWTADPQSTSSFWARKEGIFPGTSPEFLALGTACQLAGLVEVLEAMPAGQPGHKQLTELLLQVARGTKTWQDDASGCWYQLIAYDGTKKSDAGVSNAPECISSCLMTYALLKGVRLGLLPAEYKAVAGKAFQGILDTFVEKPFALKNYTGYIGIGNAAEMERDGSVNYYLQPNDSGENRKFALGAFLLTCSEIVRK